MGEKDSGKSFLLDFMKLDAPASRQFVVKPSEGKNMFSGVSDVSLLLAIQLRPFGVHPPDVPHLGDVLRLGEAERRGAGDLHHRGRERGEAGSHVGRLLARWATVLALVLVYT